MTTLTTYVCRFDGAACQTCGGTSFYEPPKMHALPHLSITGGPDGHTAFQLAALTCKGCGQVRFFDPSVVSAKMR